MHTIYVCGTGRRADGIRYAVAASWNGETVALFAMRPDAVFFAEKAAAEAGLPVVILPSAEEEN